MLESPLGKADGVDVTGCGWVLLGGALVALALTFRPRSTALGAAFALTFVVLAVVMYADRDVAPIFGQLSPDAGVARRGATTIDAQLSRRKRAHTRRPPVVRQFRAKATCLLHVGTSSSQGPNCGR